MPAFGLRPENSIVRTMKRLGLTPLSLSATLFLVLQVGRLPAQDNVGATAAAAAKPEGVQQLQELMRRFDLDGDGNLDDAERAATKEAMKREKIDLPVAGTTATPDTPKAKWREMLAQFDKNKDGRLDNEERAAARKMAAERGFGPGEDARAELLKRFDTNGNGRLDEDERAAIPERLRKRIAMMAGSAKPDRETAKQEASLEDGLRAAVAGNPALLKKFDEDKDGNLNDREWAVARKKMAAALGEK